MNTRYWKKMKTFFANKCEEQKDMPDGRTLRKYVNPQTKQAGETWEYQQQQFSGLVESLYIENKEVEFGGRSFRVNDLCIGIQSDGYVDVLRIAVTTQKGSLSKDFMAFAKKAQNIDFSKELYIDIWENHKGAEKKDDGTFDVPVYLLFKHDVGEKWPKSYPASFKYDEAAKKYEGMPEVEKETSFDGSVTYNTKARDAFLYGIVNEVIEKNKDLFDAHKAARPQTDNEIAASTPQPSAPVPPVPDVGDGDDLPF